MRRFPLKRIGSVLMGAGLAIGLVVGVGIVSGIRVNGVPFLVAVGLTKLTVVAALGLMAAGAFVRRLGVRDERKQFEALSPPK